MCVYQSLRNCLWIFVIFVAVAAVAGQNSKPTKCAKAGEYCQNHWDCCSNGCMSYLYKCTRSSSIFPYHPFGSVPMPDTSDYTPEMNYGSVPVPGTFDDILEIQFGSGPRKSNQAQPVQLRPASIYSRFGSENSIESQDDRQKGKRELATPAPVLTDKSEQSETSTTAPLDAAKCKEIGEKCYSHEECCTKRCHGFLHQCVT